MNNSIQFSLSVVLDSLDPMDCSTPGFTIHHQIPDLDQTHVHWVRDAIPTISSSVMSFCYCLQSFPKSGSFPMNQFLASGGQSIGASASVLPVKIQDWFPLGLTGWISLQSEGLSRVFSNTTVQSINYLVFSFLYTPILTSIHDYWKKT